MDRRTFAAGAAALAAPSLPARALAQAPAPPIRVGGTFSDSFAEGFYAADRGAFKEAGLDVDIRQFPNGPIMQTAVLGNALDIAESDTVSLATAVAKGAPFVVIAGAGQYSAQAPTTALCVPNASPLRSAKDLEGKTVGVLGLRDLTEIGTRAWLDRNGADASKVKFAEFPLPQVAPTLERGAIDAGILAEPFLSRSTAGGMRVLGYVFNALAPQFFISNWFTTRSYADAHPAAVRRFVEVVYATARWANEHRAETAPMLARLSKLDPSAIAGMTRVSYGTALEPRLIDPVLAALATYHVTDRTLTANDLVWR